MKLPPFDEFEKTITTEQREEWFNAGQFNVREKPTTHELVHIAMRAGYLSARGLLIAYHAWLNEQLKNAPPPRE